MKTLSENLAAKRLEALRKSFRKTIEQDYEPAARDCLTCDVQGSCCTDAHFVNVHVSRLEAVAIHDAISRLESGVRQNVIDRNEKAVASLSAGFTSTYACPLFEKGTGCLVHATAKPLPCINHACYENKDDLPPSTLLENAEEKIGRLNDRVYRKHWNWLPIPVWLQEVLN